MCRARYTDTQPRVATIAPMKRGLKVLFYYDSGARSNHCPDEKGTESYNRRTPVL